MEPLGWGEPFKVNMAGSKIRKKKWWFSEIYTIDSSINGGFSRFFYHFTWIQWWFHGFFYHFTNAGILQPYLMTGGPSEVATPRLITVIPKISTDSGARWGSGNRCRNFLETLGMSTYCWLYFWLHTRYG